jgi:hypothetical protein
MEDILGEKGIIFAARFDFKDIIDLLNDDIKPLLKTCHHRGLETIINVLKDKNTIFKYFRDDIGVSKNYSAEILIKEEENIKGQDNDIIIDFNDKFYNTQLLAYISDYETCKPCPVLRFYIYPKEISIIFQDNFPLSDRYYIKFYRDTKITTVTKH